MRSRTLALPLALLAACGQHPANLDGSTTDVVIDARSDTGAEDSRALEAATDGAPDADREDAPLDAGLDVATDDASDVGALDAPTDDAVGDVATDTITDTISDASTPDDRADASDTPDAGPCIAGDRRCNGARIETCVLLSEGTTAWAVTSTCDGLQTCAGTPPACVFPDVEPSGGVVAPIGTYVDGLPQGVVWNGTTGTALFHWGDGGSRHIGLFQFTASGLSGAPYTSDTMQGGRITAAGSSSVVFWHDGGFHSYLALVGAGATLGARVEVNVAGGAVYQGFTLAGSANGAMLAGAGSVTGTDGAFTWFDARSPSARLLTPTLLNNGLETGVSTATATGLAFAWEAPDAGLVFQAADGDAHLVGSPVRSAPPWTPTERVSLVALVPRADGSLLIWSGITTRTLHFARLDTAGALVGDRVVATDYDSRAVVSPFVGMNGDEILLARGIFTTVNSAFYYALAIRGVDDTGVVTRPEFLVSSRSAVATYAAGSLAVCWTVDDDEGGRGGATGAHCSVRGL